ncbi:MULTISPECIES: hypothetical protein [unclassified Micromonospora]|uniref:hypothetical protein n=1 Tax=unclassified Micromonospora TaxID=2617518 RepID=UPI0033ECE3CC
MVILVLMAGIDGLKQLAEPLVLILFFIAAIVLVIGWVAAILLARDTTRLAVGQSGLIDPGRSMIILQHLLRDTCSFRNR